MKFIINDVIIRDEGADILTKKYFVKFCGFCVFSQNIYNRSISFSALLEAISNINGGFIDKQSAIN